MDLLGWKNGLLSYKYDINLFVQKCNENYICAPTTMHFAFLTRSMRLLYHNLWETCLYILLLLTIPFILLYQVGQKSTFYAIFCSILILIYLTYTIAITMLIPWKYLQRNAILMIMPVYMVWIWKKNKQKNETEISFWCFDFWRKHKSFLLVLQGSSSMALPGFCLKNQDCVCC